MAINLRKEVGQKSTVGQLRSEFKTQHKITVNEPAQTHFSAEGVQAYSPEEIAALKARGERVSANAQKDGEYVKTQAYRMDEEIEFDRPATAVDQGRVTLKPKKGKKEILEEAKPEVKVKPSVKNQLGRANQKIVQRDKQKQQKEQYEKRLQDLKEEYKKHFGGTLKASLGKKIKKQEKEKENKQDIMGEQEGQEQVDFQVEEEQGQQCLPGQKKENHTTTKAGQPLDDSFEQVQWQGPARSVQSKSSRLNASSYSQKLGNAVHLLFD